MKEKMLYYMSIDTRSLGISGGYNVHEEKNQIKRQN